MNRRQFLTGISTCAVAAALPKAASPTVGIDLASGPDRAVHWIFESTPGYVGTYFRDRFFWATLDKPNEMKWSTLEPSWWPPKGEFSKVSDWHVEGWDK